MSVIVEPEELSVWYKGESYENEWIECRNDMLIINYQERTITTSYDTDKQVGIIITNSFDRFHLETL